MVSRRQYFAIMLIFFVVFLLFQGLQLGKLYYSTPNENKYIVETDITSSSMRKDSPVKKGASASDTVYSEEYEAQYGTGKRIMYVGLRGSEYMKTVVEWAFYTGRGIEYHRTLPSYNDENIPYLILIEPSCIIGHEELIMKYLTYGTNFVFLSIPDAEYISERIMIKRLLGIWKYREANIELHGIRLFDGFMLGGERLFEIPEPAEPDDDRQDLDLIIPWYTVRLGTETYMQGILNEDDQKAALKNKLKNEDMPAVIWRNHFRNGEVFAVNGSYLQNRRIGLGMLESFINQIEPYEIYPIVNARSFVLTDYPILTNENTVEVARLYGENVEKTQTDIILPMLISLTTQKDIKPTLFFNLKYNSEDPAQPESDALKYYLEMLFEMDGELGMSLTGIGNTGFADRLNKSYEYIDKYEYTYPISAAYINTADADSLSAVQSNETDTHDLHTIVFSEYDSDKYIIGYINNNITYQQPTNDLDRHTFTNELELIGVHTLLGYNLSSYDVARAFYPKEARDEWHKSSQRLFSNLITYDYPYRSTDQLTVTESNMRVRNYLSLRYTQSRTGNTITINTHGYEGHTYFILRLHNEEIESYEGCSIKEIETGAYLLDITEATVKIQLKNSLSDFLDIRGGNR